MLGRTAQIGEIGQPMQVIFHIGMPKCASTSLQAHFANNDELYRQSGFLYPVSHRSVKGYRRHQSLLDPGLEPEQAAEDILMEAEASSCNRILLSTEDFISNRSGQFTELTSAFSARLGPDAVSYLCLIREPMAMLRSSYHQFVRAGLWGINRDDFFNKTDGSINAFIEAFLEERGCHWYEYPTLINRAIDGVPAAQLRVWDVDDGTDPIEKLCVLYGLPKGTPTEAMNKRLPQQKIKLLRNFQRDFGQGIYLTNRRALIQKIDLSGLRYTPDQAICDGIDLPSKDLEKRFPDMEKNRTKALAMDNGA